VTDQPEPIAEQQTASLVPAPPAPDGTSSQEPAASGLADRPEVAVGAAFAGGLLVGLILKRLAR